MTKTNMDLSELLAKHDQGDLLRGIAEAVLQLIMETDVDGLIGAGRHERSGERTTWRNGYPHAFYGTNEAMLRVLGRDHHAAAHSKPRLQLTHPDGHTIAMMDEWATDWTEAGA